MYFDAARQLANKVLSSIQRKLALLSLYSALVDKPMTVKRQKVPKAEALLECIH